MRRIVPVIGLFLLASVAAAEIRILEPLDKLQTSLEIVALEGTIFPPGEVLVNEKKLRVNTNGTFSCGLILKPGKNYIEICSSGEMRKVRMLRTRAFPDIESGKMHWARTPVVYLSTLGIIESCPDGNFYPDLPVTRGEFAAWVARAGKLSLQKLTGDVFYDIPKEQWRAPFIKAVIDAGYMQGLSQEKFGVDDPLTIAEAVAIAQRMEGENFSGKARALLREPARSLTRGEAATLLSWLDSVQERIRDLLDFSQGYTKRQFCALNVAPEILDFALQPLTVHLKKKESIKLRVQVAPREGFSPLSKVEVDLSAMGGAADVEMVDDGTCGDEKGGDLVYSLNLSYEPKEAGEKKLRVSVTDQFGWEGKADASFLVVE